MNQINIKNKTISEINPFVYGNFMEFIERHISGMWAEMLENRRLEDRKEGKSVPEFWRTYGYNNIARYVIDDCAFTGTGCQLVDCTVDLGGYSGILQENISVTKDRAYEGHIWLKAEGLSHPVEIMVGKDYGVFFQPYGAAKIAVSGNTWTKYEFSFTSDATRDCSDFVIRFSGTGKLWIDHPSLMPADNLDGWRRDVVEYTKKLKPNIIRFPGGCYADIYHWENAIGDRDKRLPQSNYYWSDVPLDYMEAGKRTGRHWRPTEPNDVGIDEFMRFCELTDTEALICVNVGTGTPEEAARWIEYCNGDVDTPMGALRAQNGHPKPYGIKIWQIGNEMYGAWEIGYSGLDGYVKHYKEFHKAMIKADPSIEFMIDGWNGPWNRAMLKECGELFDYIDVHYYPDWTLDPGTNSTEMVLKNFFSRIVYVKEQLDELRADIENAGLTGKVKVAVCEYAITGGGWGPTRAFIGTQGSALFIAGLLNLFQRNADLIEIANFSNLTNAWWSSSIRTRREKIHASAAYHVKSMYSNLSADKLLEFTVKCDTFDASTYVTYDYDAPKNKKSTVNQDIPPLPEFDAAVTYDSANNEVVVSIINYTERDDLSVEITLDGFEAIGKAQVTTLSSPQMTWLNDFDSPDRIIPKTGEPIDVSKVNLMPCSLTYLKFPVG